MMEDMNPLIRKHPKWFQACLAWVAPHLKDLDSAIKGDASNENIIWVFLAIGGSKSPWSLPVQQRCLNNNLFWTVLGSPILWNWQLVVGAMTINHLNKCSKSFKWNVANTFRLKVLGAQPNSIKACRWSYWWMPCPTNLKHQGQALPFQSFHSTKLPILWFSPAASECLPTYPSNGKWGTTLYGKPQRSDHFLAPKPDLATSDPYAFPATWGTQRSNSINLPLFGTAFKPANLLLMVLYCSNIGMVPAWVLPHVLDLR